jgi:hypothetical protein
MNPQIETLKTELREFIALSETITPGKWEAVSEGVSPVNSWLHIGCDPCDGAFIARSRNISPTMARMLLVAVEGLELHANHGQEPERGSARYDLNKILNLWNETK